MKTLPGQDPHQSHHIPTNLPPPLPWLGLSIVKTLPVQDSCQSHQSRHQIPGTSQPAPAPAPDLEGMNKGLYKDIFQEKSTHHSTTSDLVHQFSDKLYDRLIVQVAGEEQTENGGSLDEDLYNPKTITKQIPGFRQFPFVRFIPWISNISIVAAV